MANVDGAWDCVTLSPMGEQKTVFTIKSDGDSFTGSQSGMMGSLDVTDGRIDGDTITWKMEMKMPFPITLDCKATVTGDTMEGGITAGAFGTSPMTGKRQA